MSVPRFFYAFLHSIRGNLNGEARSVRFDGALSLHDVYDPPVFTPKTKQHQNNHKSSTAFLASAGFRPKQSPRRKIWSVS